MGRLGKITPPQSLFRPESIGQVAAGFDELKKFAVTDQELAGFKLFHVGAVMAVLVVPAIPGVVKRLA